jgi:hypothetical protein
LNVKSILNELFIGTELNEMSTIQASKSPLAVVTDQAKADIFASWSETERNNRRRAADMIQKSLSDLAVLAELAKPKLKSYLPNLQMGCGSQKFSGIRPNECCGPK